MAKGSTSKDAVKQIVDGIGIGLFFAIFISLYITNFTSIILPIWIIYGIFAPLISAIAIAITAMSSKEHRERYGVKYWEETARREKEKENQY